MNSVFYIFCAKIDDKIYLQDYGLDESGDNTDDDSSSKQVVSQDSSNSRSPNDSVISKQSNSSSYSFSYSQKNKNMDSLHSTSIRQHSTISSQVRAMTEQSWQTSQKGIFITDIFIIFIVEWYFFCRY